MTPSDLNRIERNLGITLPASYRALLAAYPPEANSHTRTHWLFEDAQRVIEANLAQRTGGCFRISWPEDYFVIGTNGSDGVYFMAPGQSECIYFADHEDGSPDIENLPLFLSSHSPQEHLSIALKLQELNQEFELQEKKPRWWQVWK